MKKINELFGMIDSDNSSTLEMEETVAFWASNFPKLNTYDLFQQVDKNNDGKIQKEEWIEFWEFVLTSGYTEEEISNQLDSMMKGGAWHKYKIKKNK